MSNKNDCLFKNNNVTYSYDDILQDIVDRDLPALRDLFKADWPYASQAYIFIDNIIEWKRKNPGLKVTFTSPRGRWQDGTFIVFLNEWNYKLYFFTLNNSSEVLMTALRETKRIDWSKGPYIIDTHEKLIDDLMKTLTDIKQPVNYLLESTCWLLSKEKAIDFEIHCPTDHYIAPLKPEMSIFINSQWPTVHTFPGSEEFLAKIIEMNGGLGLFAKNGELLSWLMVNDFGALSVLQTMTKHKRKGYASLLIKELTKRKAVSGQDSMACILKENSASKSLFGGLGFVKLHDLRCVQLEKSNL